LREHPAWGFRFRILLSPEVVWFGITPEIFLHWKEGRVYLDALAGTLPQPVHPVPHALQVEHQAVVTHLLRHLQPYGTPVTTSSTRWKPVGSMVHLHTRIQAPLSREHLPDLIESLFPTPALAGSPKDEALKWIQKTEDFDRGGYGGLVGWWTPDEVFLLVAIRCGVYRKGWVRWYAGAGIVPGMDPDELWEETEWKLNVMGKLLLPSRTSGPGS
jgi:menaquinone-specific isochorismate synthase